MNHPEQGPQHRDEAEGSKLDELSEEEEASKAKKKSEETPQRDAIRSAAWYLSGITVFDCTVGEAERAAKEGCNLCAWIVGHGESNPEDDRFIAASISRPEAYTLGTLDRRSFKFEVGILKEFEIITLAGEGETLCRSVTIFILALILFRQLRCTRFPYEAYKHSSEIRKQFCCSQRLAANVFGHASELCEAKATQRLHANQSY
jgi:hypothetical protein